jgi:L-histidine N-alpha-methyltransferase
MPPPTSTITGARPVSITRRLGPGDLTEALHRDVTEGLSAPCKSLPSKYFYDEEGSRLFDEITRLPEYYLTRAEKQILKARSREIVMATGAATMIELGSGTSEKTRLLLDAFHRDGELRTFIPFDVDESTLRFATESLCAAYPGLRLRGIAGDFERHLDSLATTDRTLVVFLGSTIGNLDEPGRACFLRSVADNLKAGDSFLLGADLVKDVGEIEAAYNDSQGISAAFNLNILSVLNRRLGATFDLNGFEHVAEFDERDEAMHMQLRSLADQTVEIPDVAMKIGFSSGELIHTEISAKFRRAGLESELAEAGLDPSGWWTDPGGRFSLCLSAKV